MKRILLATTVATLCFTSFAQAQSSAPRILNYQAAIRSSSGAAVDGHRSVTVRLYRDDAGRDLAWSDTFDAAVQNGVLDLPLGSHIALPADLANPMWLGISIDGSDELRPLAQLGAAPSALTVADRSITASKMATDYVSSISINGQKLSGLGTNVNFVTGEGLDMTFDAQTNSVVLSNSQSSGNLGKGASIQGPDTTHDVKVGEHGHKTGILNFANAVNDNITFVKASASNADRHYLIPDVGGDASFVMSSGNQIIGGVKTFSSGIVLGSTFSMSGNPIQNLANPSSEQDASTKIYVDNAINTVTSALNTEIYNRTTAVAAEAAARTNADNALNANLAAEIAARIAGDNALTANLNTVVNNLVAEISNRSDAIEAEANMRQSAVAAEASARTAATNALQASLSSETVSRVAVDESLQSQIYGKADNTGLVHISGAETISGQKTFSSQIIGNISGNAGTVTDGVYATGDQIIAGTKTFLNTIQGSISSIGGKLASQVATSVDLTGTATPNNIANTIVMRNGSGGFNIGTITGSITGGTVSGSTVTATTASGGLTIGTGMNATSLTSAATLSAKTVTLPNFSGQMAVILKASGALDGSTGTVDITVNGATSTDYVIVTRRTFASGGSHHNGVIAAIAGANKVTVSSDDATDDSSFQVMVIKQ